MIAWAPRSFAILMMPSLLAEYDGQLRPTYMKVAEQTGNRRKEAEEGNTDADETEQ